MEAAVTPRHAVTSGSLEAERPARAASRAESRWRAWTLVLAASLLLFFNAWIPRIAVVDAYLTTDEGNWMGRTGLFARGLFGGDALLTRQSGHPGVTTMLTALAGLGVERALYLADYVRPDGLEKAPGYLDLIRQARRPFTVLTSLAVVASALLTWRLFGAGPGLIAGVLLALEPFFLAHSGLVHLDGMLASYMTIALLSALVYWVRGGGRGYLALCGLATGLAFLTKTPSAFLALFIPVLALVASWCRGRLRTKTDVRRLALEGLVWGGLAGGLALAAWPSLRSDFIGTLQYMIWYTETVGGGDHENFWLGQPVLDPPPQYYLVALGLRTAPAMLAGVALLLLNLVPFGPRRLPAHWRAPLIGLVVFVALFTAMMMALPKKFDRYLLPTFPSWEILAAIGFWLTLHRLMPRWSGRLLPIGLVGLGLAQIWSAAQVAPYYMSYYNPLFGGGRAAARSIVVGWGEGLDQVTTYLNTKPDAERLTLAGFYPRVLMAQFKGNVLPDKQYDPAQADYIVLYVNAVQRDLANSLRTATRGRRAEQVVTINGVVYARLYRVPPPPGRSAAGTEFGALRLDRTFLRSEERRYLKSDSIHSGDTLQVTLRWTLQQPVDSAYLATVSLLDRRGRVVAESTGQIGGPDEGTLSVRPGDFVTEVHPLVIPADATGEFELAVAVRPSQTAAAIPVTAWPEKLSAERRGADRVIIDDVQVSLPDEE